MPGYTTKFRLPYLLTTEGIYLIADTTKKLAERLDAIMTSGELKGDTGPAGARGPEGPAGATGPRGVAGPKGDTGAAGPAGPEGTAGAQGPKGDTGPSGERGPEGPAGDLGPEGPAGPTGPEGPKGDTGTSFKPLGTVPAVAELPADAEPGDAYVVTGAEGDDPHVFMWSGTAWDDLGAIQGPKGEAGAAGPAGPSGPQGTKGDTGAAGPKGDTGPAGVQGIQGPKGDTGPAGAKGDTGPQGVQGTAGAQGIQGPKGNTGDQGPKGDKGDPNVSLVTKYQAAGAVTVPHNSLTDLQMSDEMFNQAGVTRNGADYRITKAGYYRITAQINFAWKNSSAEKRGILTARSGSVSSEICSQTTSCTNALINISTVTYCSVGDVITPSGFQFTGASLGTLFGGNPFSAGFIAFEFLHN